MQTEHDRAQAEKRRGSLVGSVFIAPVLCALALLAVWMLIAILLTPGVALEGSYGSAQRGTRLMLVGFGVLIDAVGFGFLLWRLV